MALAAMIKIAVMAFFNFSGSIKVAPIVTKETNIKIVTKRETYFPSELDRLRNSITKAMAKKADRLAKSETATDCIHGLWDQIF